MRGVKALPLGLKSITIISRRALLLLILLVLGLPGMAQREPFVVIGFALPYHVHITRELSGKAQELVTQGCVQPLTWTQENGWNLPAGYSRFRFFIAIPDLEIYGVVQEHFSPLPGGGTQRMPYLLRLNGTRWYAASYNPTPTPHGAAGSCWLDGGQMSAFEALVRQDANWSQ